jgi:2-hydroxychromene-2-carboxylate isomerase
MSNVKPVDFWFTMGSTYTFLTVMRLPSIEQSRNVPFRWRPFHLLTILQEMKHVPFADKPAKAAYMWRDIERRAQMRGIEVNVPAPYPAKHSIVANKIAILGLQEGWGVEFIRGAYRRWFQLGQENGDEPNVIGALRDVGQQPDQVLKLVRDGAIDDVLTQETDQARELGIFGSPTFSVNGELFWGDDRLEDAISWFEHGRVRPT